MMREFYLSGKKMIKRTINNLLKISKKYLSLEKHKIDPKLSKNKILKNQKNV